jgi:hypothetical protein
MAGESVRIEGLDDLKNRLLALPGRCARACCAMP